MMRTSLLSLLFLAILAACNPGNKSRSTDQADDKGDTDEITVDIHPYTRGTGQKLLYPAIVSPERYDEICDFVIEKYFTLPNYWKIDGKAYFSVYDVQKFVEGFGSMKATKAAMDRLREKAQAAGLKGVHWNLVAWGNPILPVEKAPSNTPELIEMLGFD